MYFQPHSAAHKLFGHLSLYETCHVVGTVNFYKLLASYRFAIHFSDICHFTNLATSWER
jgi:hypothetical protein